MMSPIKSVKLWDWLAQIFQKEQKHLHHNYIEESSEDVKKTKFEKFWDWLN